MNRHCGYLFSIVASLSIWASGGGDQVIAADAVNSTEVERIEIILADRKLVRDSNLVRVTQGQSLELVWLSDEATELHLHGYNIELQLSPKQPSVMALTAYATGRFPITSHGFGAGRHGHETLLYLEVYPRE